MTMAKRLPFWATLMTLMGLIVLCGLGTWQLKRLAWKTDILTKLDMAYESGGSEALRLDDIGEGDFRYGRVEGTFLADKAVLLGPKTRDKKIGNDLIVPLRMEGRTLFINMGWTEWPLDEQPIYHLNNAQVWFEGVVRTPGWNSFTPENVPEKNQWYKPDTGEMAAAMELANPYPVIMYAEHASHKFDAAFPNNTRWHPNNNHMQYAVFWFSMAVILLVIYTLRFVWPILWPPASDQH